MLPRADATRGALSRALQRARVSAELGAAHRLAGSVSALDGERQAFLDGDPSTPSSVYRWFRPGLRDATSDTMRELPLQRGASRELVRTNPIAAGAIQTNIDRVVGTGLALVAAPDRRVLGWDDAQALEWKRQVQSEFSLWADSAECDWAGEQNFYDKQGLTLRAALESGDSFTVLPDGDPSASQPYRLRLQTVEADRIGNPGGLTDTAEIAGGVRRVKGRGVAQAYHVFDSHPGAGWSFTGDRFAGQWIERVGSSGRRRILHHFRQLRPEQPRGIPYLAPIVGHLKQLGRYTEAELQAAVVTAFLTVFIESEGAAGMAPIFGLTDADVAASAGAAAPGQPNIASGPEVALAPGATIGLAPGEKANVVNPLRPNAGFDPFVHAICQQIGVGLGMPVELLLKQFNASYSASKAALLDAWMWFRGQRTWLARSFCQPVYETWLAEAVATRRIAAPGFFSDPLVRWAYTRAGWHGDSMGSINPKDEVAAMLAAVDGRLMTRENAEWMLFGTDWYETFPGKKAENDMLAAADLLPVPKAGAPAPPPASGDTAGADRAGPAALAPSVTLHLQQGDTTIHLDGNAAAVETTMPAAISVEPADARVDLPEAELEGG